MIDPSSGILLIADPFLKDPDFIRTVVLVCEHQAEGTFGFVINKKFEQTIDQLMENFDGHPIPVFYGGPVQVDIIHFLHQYPELIPGGVEVMEGIFWGGDFSVLTKLIKNNDVDLNKIKFFIGYSGWGMDQLENEIKEKTWLTVKATRHLIFHKEPDAVWKDSLRHLGGDYQMMIHYPTDPQLN